MVVLRTREQSGGATRPRAGRIRRAARMTGIVFAVTLALLSMSYGRALLAPGYATWTDKTSSWIRDNGGGRLLDACENWRYAAPPSDSQPDLHQYVCPSCDSGWFRYDGDSPSGASVGAWAKRTGVDLGACRRPRGHQVVHVGISTRS